MILPNINYNLFRPFIAVYEKENITKASEDLHTVASAISYSIKELEKQLNTKLFIPLTRGVKPTKEADELYKIATCALNLLNNSETAINEFNENSIATLKINFPTYFGSQIMSGYVADFNKIYKNVRLEISAKKKTEAIELLEKNQVDLIFNTGELATKSDTLGAIILKEFTGTLFASKEFAKIHIPNNKLTKDQLEQLPMITVDKSFALRDILERIGIVQKPIAEVETTEILFNLVAAGIGIGCYASDFVNSQTDKFVKIEIIDIEIPKFYLSCRYNKEYCSKAAKAFISLLSAEKTN